MFIFLVFHQHCKSRSRALQNVLWQYHKAWKHICYQTKRLWIFEIWEILSSFLHSCVVCTTIYNKSCVTVLCQRGNKLGFWTTNSVDWCVVYTSQSWDLPNVHTWMICISVTTSDVLREMSDVWQQICCWLSWCFSPQFYILSGWR